MQVSRKILITGGVMTIFIHSGRELFFEKLHILEVLIAPIATFYLMQMYKHNIISK